MEALTPVDAGPRSRRAIEVAGGDTATPLNLRKRVALVEQLVGPLSGRRLLDAGCGGGDYVEAFARLGADAHGIELGDVKLAAAAHRSDASRERISAGDIEATGFESNHFDVVLLNEVLEHVPDDGRALREIHRVLRSDGWLVILSPNRLHPFETHGVFALRSGRRVSHATPFVPWIPLALGRRFLRYWARNYWPHELRRLVTDAGFEIQRTGFLWQTFENISGRQPAWVRAIAPLLRGAAAIAERAPLLRALGASQWLVARPSLEIAEDPKAVLVLVRESV